MSRSRKSKKDSGPKKPVVCRLSIDPRERLTIPAEIIETVSWLQEIGRGVKVECFAIRGPAGGIQIEREGGPLAEQRKDILDKLSRCPPGSNESDCDWMHLARLFAATWTVNLEVGDYHRRLTIPLGVFDSGVLGKEKPDELTLFAAGDVLEIWGCEAWERYQADLRKNKTKLDKGPTRNLQMREQRLKSSIPDEFN